MGQAVKAVIHNYQPLVILLEEEVANDDPTSIGLLEQLSSFRYVALLYLLGNVVGATNHLCRIFQYQDISFSVLQRSEVNVIGEVPRLIDCERCRLKH